MQVPSIVLTRQDLWPVTLWRLDLPAFEAHNTAMRSAIDALRVEHPEGAPGRSNPMGWQSPKVLQLLPAFQPLLRLAIEAVAGPIATHQNWDLSQARLSVESWANVNPPNSLNKIHAHAGALVSGAYYIDVPVESGAICFYNPRRLFQHDNQPPPAHPDQPSPEGLAQRLFPHAGQLLLFPGWLPHEVEPNRTTITRYSISFNLHAEPTPGRPADAYT